MLKLGGKYDEVLDPKNNEFHGKYNISDPVLNDYDYDNSFVPPLEDDKNVSSMPPLEGYKKIAYVPTMPSVEEQAKEKGLKVLNPTKILTRLNILVGFKTIKSPKIFITV